MKNEAKWAEEIRHAIDVDFSFADHRPSLLPDVMKRISDANGRRRKQTVSIVFAALLVLMALTGLAVSVLGRFVFLDAEAHGQPYACVVKDNQLFVLAQNGLWVYPSGSERAELLIDRKELPRFRNPLQVELLASDLLMLIDRDAEVIWEMQEKQFVQKRSYADTPLAQICESGADFVWQDGYLFVQSDHDGSIWRADLADCSAEKLPIENATRLTGYLSGKLLALTYHEQQGTAVYVIDTASGEKQKLWTEPGLGIKGISYHHQDDAIYAIVSGVLSRWTGERWQEVYSAALPHVPFFCGAFGDVYAAANYEGIQFVPLRNTEEKPTTLTILGLSDSARYDHGFQQANQGITVARRNEIEFDMEDAIQAILSGTEADLLHVRISTEQVDELWELLVPIDSEKLMADTNAMMPVLQSLLIRQNQLYAVPSSMIVEAWVTHTQPPIAMKDVLTNESFRVGEETFAGTEMQTILWEKNDYAAWLLKEGIREWKAGSLRFTDEAFVDTLQAIVEMLNTESPEKVWYHTAVSLAGYLHGSDGVIQYTHPPQIKADLAPAIPAWLTVYILNPNSPKQKEAVRYLEYLADHRFAGDAALMKPSSAQPELIEWAEERIAELPPSDPQRRKIEENPENWEVLAENLEYYREEIAPYLVIGDGSVHGFTELEQRMMEALTQCLCGEMTAGECANLLEQMAEEFF